MSSATANWAGRLSRHSWLEAIAAAAASEATDPGSKSRVDYREVLPPDQFHIFAKLRDLRKRIAKEDGVPPYALFTNEQLADMVRGSVRTEAELARIDGIGPSRIGKYAVRFLEILCAPPSSPPAPAAPASGTASCITR